jgi:pantetheine-phosphate adenylyltransferase
MARLACYAGSFDPVTYGHLDIMRRALAVCDRLVVAVSWSEVKSPVLSAERRAELIRAELEGVADRVEVCVVPGLIADYCESRGIGLLVRGLRSGADFEGELAMAHANRRLQPAIETVALFADPGHLILSSRLVKEIARGGGPLERFVPPRVARALRQELGIPDDSA